MDETIRLIKMAHEGDKEARETLVLNNVGLVWSIVRRFAGRGCEMEDLFQIGSIGLIKAIDKFDVSYDVRFSTYAVPMIAGEIKRFLRDDGMIKVSRSLKEMAVRVGAAREQMTGRLGREPPSARLPASWGSAARRWPPPSRQTPRWSPSTARPRRGRRTASTLWTGWPGSRRTRSGCSTTWS